MTNLSYTNYSKSKISDASITHSLSQIESSISRFLTWKSSALSSVSPPPLPISDLDVSLGQLDLITTSKPSILAGDENRFAVILAQAVLPLEGDWIWYKQEASEISPRWGSQTEFINNALPLLLITSINYLTLVLEDERFGEGRFALATALSCFFGDSYPWTVDIPTGIHAALTTCTQAVLTKYPSYVDQIFSEVIRSAFIGASSHPGVSAAGRKLFTADDGDFQVNHLSHAFSKGFMDDSNPKKGAWKESKGYVIALLEVYLQYFRLAPGKPTTKIQDQWSFFVPCILNIIDYHNPAYKRKGADLLVCLIDSVSPEFFKNTGVCSIFWSALKPSLTFLPPGTPTSIAVPLSHSTFKAMIKLSYLTLDSKKDPAVLPGSKKLQEEYLTEGIFRGVSHSHKSVDMMMVFINSTGTLVLEHLQSYATPHLKHLVAIVTGVLGDPFIVYAPALFNASINLVKTLIKTLWFRIVYYRYDIIRCIITAAKRIDENTADSNSQELRVALRECVEMLGEAVSVFQTEKLDRSLNPSSFDAEIETLKAKEPSFRRILETSQL